MEASWHGQYHVQYTQLATGIAVICSTLSWRLLNQQPTSKWQLGWADWIDDTHSFSAVALRITICTISMQTTQLQLCGHQHMQQHGGAHSKSRPASS